MSEYIAKHSILTNIGALLFFGCIIASCISVIITEDNQIGFILVAFAAVGGVLMMVGLLSEM